MQAIVILSESYVTAAGQSTIPPPLHIRNNLTELMHGDGFRQHCVSPSQQELLDVLLHGAPRQPYDEVGVALLTKIDSGLHSILK